MRANKNKVLFVLKQVAIGGSASSMINLFSIYKEKGVEFDLFLMDHSGVWTSEASQYANLLPKDFRLASSITDKKNLKTFRQYFYRICYVISHKLFGVNHAKKKLYSRAAKKLNHKYESVVAYQESETTEFASYIKAKNKVAWIHTDFEKFRISYPSFSSKVMYQTFDKIACVTESSVKSVIDHLGRTDKDVFLIRNMLPVSRICMRALEVSPEMAKKRKKFVFVSVGRLSPEKAFERIPQIAKIMLDEGIDFDWQIIGDGITAQHIKDEIVRVGVSDCVHMLGTKMNPYPYIKEADCLVITSRYEAQPMVANEALILGTPVISTEFASVNEVITEKTGIVVSQTIESIAEAIDRTSVV